MSKKQKTMDDFLYHIYIHMNEVDQFVVFSGLKLQQFLSAVDPVQNVLLLKHSYTDGLFNRHTQLDYVSTEELPHFLKKANNTAELCWIDFVNERQLNQLTPKEQAELLYLSHKREPVQSPFSTKLQNRYVYCSSGEEKMTKIYFRKLSDSEVLTANVFNQLIKEKESTSSFFRRKTKGQIPAITPEFLKAYRSFAKEGALFSLTRAEKSNYEIEVRNLSHYHFPDEIWDDLKLILKERQDEIIPIA